MMNFKFLLRGSLILLLVWGCLGSNVFGQSEINMNNRFQINKDGSYVTFGTTLANFPVIKGSLKAYQATLFYDPEKPEQTSATIRFGAEGMSTAHDKRDEQLHGPDFLDASSFPGIWFQGFETVITDQGLDLKGDLYIKGLVQPVTAFYKWHFHLIHIGCSK